MDEARLRALTQFTEGGNSSIFFFVEMDEARLRALTHHKKWCLNLVLVVEMDEARLRALTHIIKLLPWKTYRYVEMDEARLRALTHML